MCIILLLVGAFAAASLDFDLERDDETLFQQFEDAFDKHYDQDERAVRKAVFAENVARARALNARRTSAEEALFGITKFSDLRSDELPSTALQTEELPVTMGVMASARLPTLPSGNNLPAQMSYCGNYVESNTDRPRVDLCGPAVDQKSCGCCYATALANLGQYHYANKTYSMAYDKNAVQRVRVGFQRFIDIPRSVNARCCGGNSMRALETTMTWSLETDYPFVDGTGANSRSCSPRGDQNANVPVLLRAHSDYFWYSVDYDTPSKAILQLKKILHHYGPTVVGIDSQATNLASYRGGIIDASAACSKTAPNVDHAVLLVGWGVENGVEYWILQNSWYAGWGESATKSHGYFRLKTSSLCGIGFVKSGYTSQNFVFNAYTCEFMPGCKSCDRKTKKCLACASGYTLNDGECFSNSPRSFPEESLPEPQPSSVASSETASSASAALAVLLFVGLFMFM